MSPRRRQGTNAPACKRQGNVVVQGGNPDGLTEKARAPAAIAAARFARPMAEKMSKVSGMKRKKVPTKRPVPSSTPSAPARCSPTMPFNGVASTTGEVFNEMAGSGGSNNVAAEFVNLLDTNAVDIDQAPIAGFDYNEMEGGVDDHGGEYEVEEVDEGVYQQAQAKQKREIEELHDLGRSNLDQGLECGVYGCLHGCVSNLQEDKIAQQRYKDMEASEGKKFKLEHCWDMLKNCDKWKLIDKESPSKKGSLTNMDEDEDDDGPRNLNKPDVDKKTKEKIKMEHQASSLRDKIYAMVQSNELMLAKYLETKIELAKKKAREKQER
ncbi:Lactation elevated protein 1 [Hordeum vulgare]|nr:Lactation elevated protein 1 [Hordeum vulgare]